MALKLALVIDGDAVGAKKAVEETGSAIDQLAGKAKDAGDALKDVKIIEKPDGNPWEGVGKSLDDIKTKAPPAAGALDQVGDGLGKANREAPGAAAGIISVGNAAGTAHGQLSGLKLLAGTIIGGLIGGLTAGAVSAVFGALVQGVVNYATELNNDMPGLDEAIKQHTALVKAIKGAYAEAQGGASSYGNTSASVLRFQTQQDINRLRGQYDQAQRNLLKSEVISPQNFAFANPDAAPGAQLGPFRDTVQKFRKDLQDGTADVIKFKDEIGKIAENLPDDSKFRAVGEKLLQGLEVPAKLQEDLNRSVDLYKSLTGDAEAAAAALGTNVEKFQAVNDTVAGGLAFLREYDQLLKSIGGGASAPAVPQTGPQIVNNYQPFAAGGWTGPGPIGAPAGIVHGQEYVLDAATTARIGVANLDAMRAGVRGYASGGFVGTYSTTSGSASGGSADAGLTQTVSFLRGSLTMFGHDLARTHNIMDALNLAAAQLQGRLLDFAFRMFDNVLFGSGKGGFGLLGGLLGLGGGGDPWAGMRVATGHTGAVIGAAPATRQVGAHVFLGAPRMHTGGDLKAGEVPFIGMEGEEIGWPSQLSAKYGGRTIVQVIDNAGVQKQTKRTRGPDGEEIVQVLLDRVKADYADGGFDDLNRSLYGVGRNGTAR